MKKQKCRFQTATDGKREMVVPLSRDFLRTAEKMAKLLNKDRDQLVLEWFDFSVPHLADQLEDNALAYSAFKTEAECLEFIDRIGWDTHTPLRISRGCWKAEHPFDRLRREEEERRAA